MATIRRVNELRGNESFALTAMSRLLQCGNCASPRLKRSIDFFIKAFNAHMAQGLIGLARSPDGWLTSDKRHDIERLESQAPGFAGYSYEYAFMWVYGNRSARIRGQYV